MPELERETLAAQEIDRSTQVWAEHLRRDELLFQQVAEIGTVPAGVNVLPTGEIDHSFQAGLTKAADNFAVTLRELNRLGQPVGQGTEQQQADYFQDVMAEKPDADLIAWAYQAKRRVNQEDTTDLADPWDYTAGFFASEGDYAAWNQSFQRFAPQLRQSYQSAELSDRELKLLALSLRLGLQTNREGNL